MHVGQRIRITQNFVFEDFVIVEISTHAVYARSIANTGFIRLELVNGELALPVLPDAAIEIVAALTGVQNLDVHILAKVDDAELIILTDLDADIQMLANTPEFWHTRVKTYIAHEIRKFKPQNISEREFYVLVNSTRVKIAEIGLDEALIFFSAHGNLVGVRLALHEGADPNPDMERVGVLGRTALIRAAERGDVEIVRELLAAGADINAVDAVENTALTYAVDNGHLEVVKLILRVCIDTNTDINGQNEMGDTDLMIAADKGYAEIIRELLAAGADVNEVNFEGSSALILAADNGHLNAVRELLAAHPDINRPNDFGYTAVMQAAAAGYIDILRELIAAGADINTHDRGDGLTPLMHAAGGGRLDVVRELLAAYADINAHDNTGNTALTLALNEGHEAIVRELQAHEEE